MDEQRALLDALMGKERDLPVEQQEKVKKKFSDRSVCKYFICGLCPYHELFKNTKSDLGESTTRHMPSLYNGSGRLSDS
jgi:RNA-binding protein Luc7-like 2